MSLTSGQLPSYQSHKKVSADIITEVRDDSLITKCGVIININGTDIGNRIAVAEVKPSVGDYYVQYEPDGYQSWSPKSVFEDGYSLIT